MSYYGSNLFRPVIEYDKSLGGGVSHADPNFASNKLSNRLNLASRHDEVSNERHL